ncbi:hypothetical protein KKG72_01085 [bacterium]|nr:hypothetical protein [bacterium]MBU1994919.1 hypothetical protein [bacterium]
MRKIKLIVMLLFASIVLEADYCIQVSSMDESERNLILNEAKSEKYNQFSNIRVEGRGRYLVLRVGDYLNYSDAGADLAFVRKSVRDAFIRKCDFINEKTIYTRNTKINNNAYKEVVQPIYNDVSRQEASNQTYRDVSQEEEKTQDKQYIKKRELSYTSQSVEKTLWEDCKKCFIPIYEEDDRQDVEKEPIKVVQNQAEIDNEIEVRVHEKQPEKNSFWAEEIAKSKSNNTDKQNKFNINEQFLP